MLKIKWIDMITREEIFDRYGKENLVKELGKCKVYRKYRNEHWKLESSTNNLTKL